MIEDKIFRLVTEHYRDAQTDILLLSRLGKILIDKDFWPIPGEKRTLLDVLDKTPGVNVVRDEEAASFIAVVLNGDESRARSAIAGRHRRHFLRGLARPVLLAFTLDVADGHEMAIRLGPKVSYRGGPVVDQDAIVVDRDLRIPGLDVEEMSRIPAEDIERLDLNIRTWCERHNVDPDLLVRSHRPRIPPRATLPITPVATDSALARLYAAQLPEIARRLAIPADIALLLSRLP